MCKSNSRPYIVYIFKPYGVQYPDLGCRSHLSIAFTEGQKREMLEGKKVSCRWDGTQSHEDLHSIKTFVTISPLMSFPPPLFSFLLFVVWRFCSREKQFFIPTHTNHQQHWVNQSDKASVLNVL